MSDTHMPINDERLKTAKLAMRFLRSPDTRALMKRLDLLTTPVVLAEYGSLEGEVQKLVELQDNADRVLILIRKEDDTFVSISAVRLEPTQQVPDNAVRSDEVGPDITIGQVWEALGPNNWDVSHLHSDSSSSSDRPMLANYQLAAIG